MKLETFSNRRRAWATCLGALVLLAGVAGLRAAQQHATAAPTPCVAPNPAANAMRVAIDPETGQLGMPSGDASKATDLLPAEGPAPVVQYLADGSMRARVQGHFRHYSVARIGADGRLETECTQDRDAAHDFLCGHGATTGTAATAAAPATPAAPAAPATPEVQ